MKLFFKYLGIFIIFNILLSCSSVNKLSKKAMKAFENGEYYGALTHFEKLYEIEKSKSKKGKWSFYEAECYRHINESNKAEKAYNRAIKRKYEIEESTFLYAEQLRKNGKYQEAMVEYENLKNIAPANKRWEKGYNSCLLAESWIKNPTRYKVEELKEINSKENDFCPSYSSDDFTSIVFTSCRQSDDEKDKDKEAKKSAVSGMPFTNLFETRFDRKGKWSNPTAIEDTIVNTEYDDGAATFSADKKTMYLTFCKIETGKQLGCRILALKRKGNEWGGVEQQKIVEDSISVGHPSISDDGKTLYFASKMRGGFGGFDIWKCERESVSALWGEPENLGSAINSPGDELYPYIRKDGNLYFSSDYWEGMGGLDIFKAQKDEFGMWQIMNMMYPVNSSQDDFGIVFQGKREIGLFSSTRDGGKGGDDIYSFVLPELELNVAGKLIDKSTAKPIEEASVTLIGSDGTIKETKTKSDGSFKFNLSQYIDYLVVGSGEGFLKKKKRFSTNNIIDDTTFVLNIELITISKAVEIPNIFYDFGKWTLNESSKTALEELAQLLEDNPNITIEMGAHTDMVGDSAANMKLSLKRAESVVSYLKEKGYDSDRLVARGYGENRPVIVDEKLAITDTIFVEGQVLDQNFIITFDKDKQDKINQINRRTELRILNTNYIPKPEYFLRYKKNKMKYEENLNVEFN